MSQQNIDIQRYLNFGVFYYIIENISAEVKNSNTCMMRQLLGHALSQECYIYLNILELQEKLPMEKIVLEEA